MADWIGTQPQEPSQSQELFSQFGQTFFGKSVAEPLPPKTRAQTRFQSRDKQHILPQPQSVPHGFFNQPQQRQQQQQPIRQQEERLVRPRPFLHECKLDLVCSEPDCRVLQKLICSECAPMVHPNHQSESLEWYFYTEKEKVRTREFSHNGIVSEVRQDTHSWRQKRMKAWKNAVKIFKKIELECRAVEEFTRQKINQSLTFKSRKEAYDKLVRLFKQSNHPKLEQLKRVNQDFEAKEEEGTKKNESPEELKSLQNQIIDIVDKLFLADEREKDKIMSLKASPSPQRAIRQLRTLDEQWHRHFLKYMGANKRFVRKMLNETRLSIRNKDKLNIQVVEVNIQLEEDDQMAPKVLQVLPLGPMIVTVHPDEIRLWKYNTSTYTEFKPITGLKVSNLKYVAVALKRQEFYLLHQNQEVWAIRTVYPGTIARVYKSPLKNIELFKILVSGCEQFLFASGGVKQKGFFILHWSLQNASLLRILRHQFSFPHNGDLLTSYNLQHIYRCNMNTVDIFHIIHGQKIQTLTLSNVKERIEIANLLPNFQGSDSICLSTEKGAYYVYSYDYKVIENNYRLTYKVAQGSLNIYNVFYQHSLAEEGFLIALLENNETKIFFQTLNGHRLLQQIQIKDQVICGKLDYYRDPWKNQLTLLLGFESGLLRFIIIAKNLLHNIRSDIISQIM